MTTDLPPITAEHVMELVEPGRVGPVDLVLWLAAIDAAGETWPPGVEAVPRVLWRDISWSNRGRPHMHVSTRDEVIGLMHRYRGHAVGPAAATAAHLNRQAARLQRRDLEVQAETELVGVTEIAERAGVNVNTVHAWRRRHAAFPAPIAELAAGPVWSWTVVGEWLRIPRPPGRPRKDC